MILQLKSRSLKKTRNQRWMIKILISTQMNTMKKTSLPSKPIGTRQLVTKTQRKKTASLKEIRSSVTSISTSRKSSRKKRLTIDS